MCAAVSTRGANVCLVMLTQRQSAAKKLHANLAKSSQVESTPGKRPCTPVSIADLQQRNVENATTTVIVTTIAGVAGVGGKVRVLGTTT